MGGGMDGGVDGEWHIHVRARQTAVKFAARQLPRPGGRPAHPAPPHDAAQA
jgi:hypothetical protein